MPHILLADPVSKLCAERLLEEPGFEVDSRPGLAPDELKAVLPGIDALVVRSATKVTREVLDAAPDLKAIGRAGSGVDNIDVEAATERGIVVMNTPGGNTISAAEHTFALMMALARRIPEGHQSVGEGKWERSKLLGVELHGKTLGIFGLGKIGREVASRAQAFGMEVLGHDPFVPEEQAQRMNVEFVEFSEILARSDFLTVHTPLTSTTRHRIGNDELTLAKPGIRLINCARGGIYDEGAVAQALGDGRVAGAAFDVFETEPPTDSPLRGLPGVIFTPHLGASTIEAQEKVAVRIADQLVEFFQQGNARYALNAETIDPSLRDQLQPFLLLSEKLGRLHAHLQDSPLREIRAEYHGDLVELPTRAVTAALLKGYLENFLSEPVNQVNAWVLAKRTGITVTEVQSGEDADFTNLITTNFQTSAGTRSISGTLFGRNRPRIVRLDDYHVELIPEGDVFFYSNDDRPGIIGKVGSVLGKAEINIGEMSMGRDRSGGTALGIFRTDSRVPDDVAKKVEEIEGILWTRRVRL